MRAAIVIMMVLVFALGWVSSSLLAPALLFDSEKPFSFSVWSDKAVEQKSPSNHVAESDIHVYSDEIVLDVQNAIFAKYADTNSMDPLLDKDTNGIEIKPTTSSQIKIGDVISYRSRLTDDLLVHRVVNIGFDDAGKYFIVKGDNNPSVDPEKVRFSQVHGVLIGVIY